MENILQTPITKDHLKELIASRLEPYKPFFASLSGSHIYGFHSKDSDIDIRGAYLLDKNKLLGLSKNKDLTITSLEKNDSEIEIDFVSHEVRKFADMVAGGKNGYVLEQLFSPIVIYENDEFQNFKDNVNKFFITKLLYTHYNGFANDLFEKFKTQEEKKIKNAIIYL